MKHNEQAQPDAVMGASLGLDLAIGEEVQAARFTFQFECHNAEGELLWTEEGLNVVTTVGKDFTLDTLFSGSAYTAAWFFLLIDNASFTAVSASDTMASHAGWIEFTGYSQATRQSPTWGASSGGVKATTVGAIFTINATGTLKGAGTTTNSTKGGTTGTLYNAFAFASTQPVVSTNTITVTASMTQT